MMKTITLICATCHQSFERLKCRASSDRKRGMKHIFCSRECYFNYDELANECLNCGKSTKNHKFCDTSCTASYYASIGKPSLNQKYYIKKKQVILTMGGKCSRCGYNKNLASLDFHHLDPNTKSFNLNATVIAYGPQEAVQTELKKCVVLCRNCHSELHNPVGDWNNLPDVEVNFAHTHKITLCYDCGKEVTNSYMSKRCPDCNNKSREKATWPDIIELIDEVNQTTLAAVAKRLGVTHQAVHARIERHKAKGKNPSPAKKCSLCDRKHYAKGLCQHHWQVQRRFQINDLIQLASL
jgi:hypothetical protein